ncbi:GNAT family N-acetyltransferase [Streptomyces griseolus]|uniref:GNAT family N-acetyltransferase n=1 Tax=Streptomyces griseolus TaxID=1909 RepID=UPI0022442B2C|nr:GNAT family N-acetyltransferase [Streptomyces griseolus]
MSELHIRRAAPADIDAVLRFWTVAAEGTSISDDHAGVARLLARDPEALLLAERDGVLAGTVIAGYDGWRCSLYRLAGTAGPGPPWRRRSGRRAYGWASGRGDGPRAGWRRSPSAGGGPSPSAARTRTVAGPAGRRGRTRPDQPGLARSGGYPPFRCRERH